MNDSPDMLEGGARAARRDLAAICMLLAGVSLSALLWCLRSGSLLNYGDAEAHLNIARRLADSRTPGLREVGTVWLPVPHVLMMPFASIDALWRTGLAGAIPNGGAYIVAGAFLFAATRRLWGRAAALTTVALFALNPNLLYLQAIPMTEPIFFAALGGVLYCAVRFRDDPSLRFAAGAGAAAFMGSLTRYEGWFLIPFVAVYLLSVARRPRIVPVLVFAGIATAGPLLWLAHNLRWWGDPLEFLRATRAAAGQSGGLRHGGGAAYPGDHDWLGAWLYYWNAVELCSGLPLLLLGMAGAAVAFRDRAARPLLLLLPAPLFYVWTIHSSGIRLFVPQLPPYGSYNTRYGLAALPLLAVAAGALVARTPRGWRRPACAFVAVLAIGPSLIGWPDSAACWREARDTSVARRGWTHEAAAFLRTHYHPGDGLLMSFGDAAGALREAGIPLREALTQDNGSEWQDALKGRASRGPVWALATTGDRIAPLVAAESDSGGGYECLDTIRRKGAPTVQICRRGSVSAFSGQQHSPVTGASGGPLAGTIPARAGSSSVPMVGAGRPKT